MDSTKVSIRRPLSLAIGACLGTAPISLAQTPGFHALGRAPGTPYSVATALSADGRHAAGYSGGGNGFVWSEAAGRYDFGFELMAGATLAHAISGDGSTVVGDGGDQPFRWQGPDTTIRLGLLAGYPRGDATGVSGDGSVVVGRGYYTLSPPSQAFRWTAATGMVGLGFTRPGHFQSEATAISRDGNTIVGWSMDAGSGFADPFSWTNSGGMHILPQRPGSWSPGAYGVNRDGSIIVGGDAGIPGVDGGRALMWDASGLHDLGVPAGWSSSGADHVSDDGSVILGGLVSATEGVDAVWTSSTGFVPFLDYLALNGISVPAGYAIRDVTAMSGDGRTFCGEFGIGNLPGQAFVVTIPAPGSLAVVGFGVLVAARRRR